MHMRLFASTSVCALILVSGARAQTAPATVSDSATLEEVIVTADKTGARALQTVPEAVSVVSASQLKAQGLNNIRDVAPFVPNVTYTQSLASAAIFVRGVGSINVNAGSDPDVTTQVDGVYMSRPTGQVSDFLDIASIEVLRGPQGTLYGRNAVGGVMNIVSKVPSRQTSGEVRLDLGNYDHVQGGLYLTGPLSDTVAVSLAANYLDHDAYFKNVAAGPDVGEAHRGGVKLQLLWEPSTNVSATTRLDYSASNEAFQSFSSVIVAPAFAAPLASSVAGTYRKVAIDAPQNAKSQFSGVSQEINWRFAEGWNLKSISAARDSFTSVRNDSDATEFTVQDLRNKERDAAYSQEFNLQRNTERFRGVAGLYFFSSDDRQSLRVMVPPSVNTPAARAVTNAADPHIKSTSKAIFAQGTYDLTDKVSVVAGARYTDEQKTFDQYYNRISLNPATAGATLPGFPVSFSGKNKYHAFTPKIGLNFQASDDAMLYASITKGFKSGGFNYSTTNAATAAFEPETIWSYEGGAKTEWFDHRLRLNLSAFYYDYTNMQVQQLLGPGNAAIGNAASAKVKGVELEMVAKVSASLTLTGNVSALNAEYGDYATASVPQGLVRFVPTAVCVAGPAGQTCTNDASGNKLSNAPSYSGAIGADWTHYVSDYKVTAHLDYAFRGRSYYDPSNAPILSQGAYGLFNAHLAIASPEGGWTAQVYGKNLGDKKYYTIASASGVTPNGSVGDPRTYGVRLTRSF